VIKYIVVGTDANGNPVRGQIEGNDEQHARDRLGRRGIIVTTLEREGIPSLPSPPNLPMVSPREDVQRASAVRVALPPRMPAAAVPTPGDLLILKMRKLVESVMTPGETLGAIAVQKKPVMNVSPDAVAATSRRVIIYRTKMLGRMSMEDFLWTKLLDAKLSEGFLGATLTFQPIGAAPIAIDHLPKEDARAIYRYAQQREEEAAVTRRDRTMEESRAAAGGVTVNSLIQPGTAAAQAPAGGDLMSRMRSLKEMLDAGFIDKGEFEAKKAEIMRSI